MMPLTIFLLSTLKYHFNDLWPEVLSKDSVPVSIVTLLLMAAKHLSKLDHVLGLIG